MKISIDLPDIAVAELRRIAGSEDVTVGQIIRDALDREFRRRAQARRDGRTDERLVAPLRSVLADDLAWSDGWCDLQTRLARKGFLLREAGSGLILCDASGARICKASELGYSHARLAERFGAPFPQHGNATQVRRFIAGR